MAIVDASISNPSKTTLCVRPQVHRPLRVFLVDDHEVVRAGIHHMLDRTDDIEVVGEAGTCAEAIARIPATRPQVAVLDVQLPDGSGVEVCREVRSHHPEVACLMLTAFADEDALLQSVLAGASGYVLKHIRGTELADAVRCIAAGGSLIDPAVTGCLLERLRHPEPDVDPRIASLTPLERTVLEHMSNGLTNRQIGEQVHLAEKTVKNYVSSVLAKLGVSRRTEAAVFAVKASAAHPN
jgi:two-component system, NarL family, response regulator DevR